MQIEDQSFDLLVHEISVLCVHVKQVDEIM